MNKSHIAIVILATALCFFLVHYVAFFEYYKVKHGEIYVSIVETDNINGIPVYHLFVPGPSPSDFHSEFILVKQPSLNITYGWYKVTIIGHYILSIEKLGVEK